MNKSKILSFVISTVMCISMMFGTISVNAADEPGYGLGDLPVYYTLEQLFEMSDDDFFALEGAESCYIAAEWNEAAYKAGRAGISGHLYTPTLLNDSDVKKYKANITEIEIQKLLGDTVKYEISSPIYIDPAKEGETAMYFSAFFSITFPDYKFNASTDIINDEDLVEFAKCRYCVSQVIDLQYYNYGVDMNTNYQETIVTGDVNLDKAVDLYDVIWIASDLVDIFKLTEGQQKIGDVNEDGVCDLYDAIEIARTIMEEL